MSFVLLPALDVADGQAVQLVQLMRNHSTAATISTDPRRAALAWQSDGAQWIHLVDLDAAFGRGSNAHTLATLIGELDAKVELSGGIRDDASLQQALSTGRADQIFMEGKAFLQYRSLASTVTVLLSVESTVT